MKIKRTHSLKYIFVKYFISVILSFIAVLVICFSTILLIIGLGLVEGANAIEKELESLKVEIRENDNFDFSKLPTGVLYAVVENDNSIIQTNMTKKEQNYALDICSNQVQNGQLPLFYIIIERKADNCILFYEIKPRYTIPWMEKFLPDVDILILLLSMIGCIAVFVLLTFLFAKKLKKSLSPIIELTEKIRRQDLDFNAKMTDITEFNDVINSIEDMKKVLKETLIKNWNMEQVKHEQIAALAHDIKTPLTVIKGNTELLSLTRLTDKQNDFVNYSINNIEKVEKLLRKLSELNKGNGIDKSGLELFATDKFITQISEEIKALAVAKRRTVSIVNKLHNNLYININIELLNRAVMNIISNAISYSEEDTSIEVDFSLENGLFEISCIDEGRGFSREDLKKAKQQFYRGDKSRSDMEHSGLGLSIADDIVRSFGGNLKLGNNAYKGAEVSILLPVADMEAEFLKQV